MIHLKTSSTLLTLSLTLLLGFTSAAQNIQIKGQVVEENSKQPLAFATVAVVDSATNEALSGSITEDNGKFTLETEVSNFYVQVSYMGFISKSIKQFEVKNNKVNLGVVLLTEDTEQLNEVVVRAEVSRNEFKLDKRVFNVGRDISNTGASALEVLGNVPSVSVNIDGDISLRGSQGVQVLINGKPSILTEDSGSLGSITSDMIEKIEVITNPSAKYEAEGTSGIINIIIKKEERKGVNGSVSLNAGVPDNNSVGVSLNKRSEKFNLFTQMGLGRRSRPQDNEYINEDLINNTTLYNIGDEYRNEKFYTITLGTDYYLNDDNVFTLSGNYAFEDEDQPSDNNYQLFDVNDNLDSEWKRSETTEASNPKWQYELQYKRDFKDHEDHDLLISATGRSFSKDQNSTFTDETISGDDRDASQKTRTEFGENTYTFKIDYTKPFSEKWSMETGAQYVINDVSNDYEVQDLINGNYETNLGLTNVFEFDQNVLGIYATGAYKNGKWGVKPGLRYEYTQVDTYLVDTDEDNSQDYSNLFPSIHTSYKVSDAVSLQAGYSNRIYRPRLWDLNPFFNIRNNFNIRQGNPDLQPEFTDSYEITSIFDVGKTSLNFGLFHRYTSEVIERVQTSVDNVIVTRPENIGTNSTVGIEFNTKFAPVNWLSFNVDFNYNHFTREGSYESTVFDFKGNQWNYKILAKLRLPADIDFEATSNYNSAYRTLQSEVSAIAFLDLGLRKKILKGKGVVSMSVRDVFESRYNESVTIQDDFEAYSHRQRGRFVTFGFSYGFGKGDAMEYSGGRR
ncbi:outer membrane beta-barrel family protein [Tamlana sp. 2_MG-2023]|uniref:outer membrane beta-barrel family protein n=1 Tax=unclassified Tamlana TaxID=2614803 RepID=UPI0026E192E9|nr:MULTISPECIES: outer membrane beta-barrel family protein [unclassified Tamlana]MDO6758925.1 outer membrane beta-barrel family protein [Tamlana sp. 2_MG-2023]MDO6789624.1 outer membrane beta-barrel family protein [Tamlana sp. 1_MG-2023]